ncbi:hypothetical protein [Arthrobacter bambusae]|uniref:hypothetical protein n=1 Tax=Arthrobacter bambusae TaxID=1338426 RepID=UPI0027838E87|nr:hypothetical protein [Arthrobacter bambusae]MDQ0028596.1 hypothetical protein [Arthrobacter bambusae]MDQ0096610.1 hypothetical protein [Arthrobacter bambusae]
MNATAQLSGPIRLHFEGLGTITLPDTRTLAFLGSVGVLAAVGLVEWPVAILFLIARLFAGKTTSPALQGIADALAITR